MEQYLEFIQNHPILTGGWLVIFFALVYQTMQSKFSRYARVDNSQLTQMVNKLDAIVVDIRGEADYKKGHIAGAKHILLNTIEKGSVAALEKHKDTPIVVVCTAGLTAAKAANKLIQDGFTEVNILEGGMNSWNNANLPVAKA
ncbi:rhodanese-like domain-containing protein [Saccharobesus litoralis]|uniref:Rhodanese-like domain-containing protein n=1 Tax=Saccharobesus litoralis TaxID=2172099 RepID=A0A2S0VXM4_9ALTE|nr:rhodanese-like domain-containing protein [Saccharobesus litoralis]AWB68976.1 rhodanese-like domain-containing protein [Saccharobesus litoralis]